MTAVPLCNITVPGDMGTATQKNSNKINFRSGRTYKDSKWIAVRSWLQEVLLQHVPEEPFDGVLGLTVRVYWTANKAHKNEHWRNTKPDADGVLAGISDQLEYCGYVVNDSRFVKVELEKHWVKENPRLEIEIYRLDD